ncbi:hypothetical protein IW140_002111 [Coemansia sp. RSA 1813]|nr:hypothetical protein EV178_001259 [Coemansia sp. RSA 1646]KAJ1772612.1 hypothetical protein LPJ74_001328 [Coemansia sp. RSA 1843]KAJ2091468.1 hypothetical protein IW138_001927 [Coemansia sp. RSA 986]KAJ2570685.1 hypothetical protein IW140_002111 [Coemansia sp. RSA 1813]
MAADKTGATPEDMKYIIAELKYYKPIHGHCQGNMALGGVDMVWTKDIPTGDNLTVKVRCHAAIMEAHPIRDKELKDNAVLMLIAPLLYPLDHELSHLLLAPIGLPAAALKANVFGNRLGY